MSGFKDFTLHLRLNYNFFILSAPFFLGALYLPHILQIKSFVFLFLLVYIFLFGGANAYNSYFDKDEGPIGGLEYPPRMEKWMYFGTWILQLIGLSFSFLIGHVCGLLFAFSVILFWLYSSPHFRFKGKPILSFIVVGLGTVFNATLMGYTSAGGETMSFALIIGALGATFLILSMYPFSQAYQIEEDTKRGDLTFASKYGIQGIKWSYLSLFLSGVLLMAYSFIFNMWLAVGTLIIGLLAYGLIWQVIKNISGQREEYRKVMRTKYVGGIAFTLAMAILLIIL